MQRKTRRKRPCRRRPWMDRVMITHKLGLCTSVQAWHSGPVAHGLVFVGYLQVNNLGDDPCRYCGCIALGNGSRRSIPRCCREA
jgi:hypothetical protein